MTKDDSSNYLKVVARNREETIFNGVAKSLSSINSHGSFDILPNHANFISVIRSYFRVVKPDDSIQTVNIAGNAVLRVYKNNVYVYVEISTV